MVLLLENKLHFILNNNVNILLFDLWEMGYPQSGNLDSMQPISNDCKYIVL